MTVTVSGRILLRFAIVLIVAASASRVGAAESPPSDGMPDPSRIGRAGFGEGPGEPEARSEEPDRLGSVLERFSAGRLQRSFDQLVGLDSGDRSERPRAPEIGEPVFFDLTRPLGDRKYSNELNYLFNSSTANGPTLQILEYEYTFTDWRSAELDLSYYNGKLEILTPFYQRTLGVGRRRNWVHGYQVSPDYYLRSGFLGGSAFYVLGWKPEEESRFSSLIFLGANRALIGGFRPGPGSAMTMALARPAADLGEPVFGAWRPTLNVDLFYRLGAKFTAGVESDLLFGSGQAGEYLVFPFLTYEAGEHAFFQIGGGYYHFEARDQFTFLLHLNFVNPSSRKAGEEARRDEPSPPREEPSDRGRFRRCLDRILGER